MKHTFQKDACDKVMLETSFYLCNILLHLLMYDKINTFVLQQLEVVPLFGDMQIAPFNYIKKTPNFESGKWPISMSNQTSSQADLLSHMDGMREDHVKYISELARHSNEVITTQRETPRTDDENRELCDLALRGLQIISQWNVKVMELVRQFFVENIGALLFLVWCKKISHRHNTCKILFSRIGHY